MIGNLRNMANDMGGEVSFPSIGHSQVYYIYNPLQVQKQNEQLDRINKKAESDKMRVKMANDKAQALMK